MVIFRRTDFRFEIGIKSESSQKCSGSTIPEKSNLEASIPEKLQQKDNDDNPLFYYNIFYFKTKKVMKIWQSILSTVLFQTKNVNFLALLFKTDF